MDLKALFSISSASAVLRIPKACRKRYMYLLSTGLEKILSIRVLSVRINCRSFMRHCIVFSSLISGHLLFEILAVL